MTTNLASRSYASAKDSIPDTQPNEFLSYSELEWLNGTITRNKKKKKKTIIAFRPTASKKNNTHRPCLSY